MLFSLRLRLRPVDREDLPRFAGWINDPEVRTNLAAALPISQAAEQQWFEKALQGSREEFPFVIEIRTGTEWLPIGGCGFHFVDWRNRCASIGLLIGERGEWGRGYGTETVRLLTAHGFDTLNLNRVWLRVYESNRRGIRAYEKAGFVHEGTEREGVYREGKYENVWVMSVLRAEWRQESPGD